MKLDEKRKVIEVLLCCSSQFSTDTIHSARRCAGFGVETGDAAHRAFVDACGDLAGHHVVATEAAYRLIESSPTLRREWFRSR